jgi:hypothetical protein
MAELMVVVAITAILYIEMPDMIGAIEGPRGNRALSDATMIARGLWGLNEDSNGYVGDLGLPMAGITSLSPLNDLAFPPPGHQYAARWNFAGVSGGWNGPYVGFQVDALSHDPWLSPWHFTNDGRIWSYGPDQLQGTVDDVYIPPNSCPSTTATPCPGPVANGTTGTILVTVYDQSGTLLTGTNNVAAGGGTAPSAGNPNVQIYISNPNSAGMGKLALPTATWTGLSSKVASFELSGMWPGQHGIEILGQQGGNCSGAAPYAPYPIPAESVAPAIATAIGTSYVNDCQYLVGHAIAFVTGGAFSNVSIRLQ